MSADEGTMATNSDEASTQPKEEDDGIKKIFMEARVPQRQGRRQSRTVRPKLSDVRPANITEVQTQEDPPPSFGALATIVGSKTDDPISGDPSMRVQFMLDKVDEEQGSKADEELHPLFCQMNELDTKASDLVWRESARWIKFEEDVEEGGERWSKPYVATLSLLSLFDLRNAICSGEVVLNVEAQSTDDISDVFLDQLILKSKISIEQRDTIRQILMKKHWNLHEKRMVHSSSFLGSKIRSFADIGKKHSSKDLEIDGQQASGLRVNKSSSGMQELGEPAANSDGQSPAYKFDHSFMRKIPQGAETANILVGSSEQVNSMVAGFMRLKRAVVLPDVTEVPVPTRFVLVLLGPAGHEEEYREMGRCMGTLMTDEVFRDIAYLAKSKEDLLAGFDEFLKFCIVLPPNEWDPTIRIEPPKEVPSQELRKQQPSSNSLQASASVGAFNSLDKPQASRQESANSQTSKQATAASAGADEEGSIDKPLERTGRLFGGLLADIKRKAPFFVSDFKDALHVQTIGAFFFIYFACLTPIITFGGLLTDATEGNLGAIESILSGAVCGVSFSLFAGQPLTILGSTGPVLIFETIVFKLCKESGWDYLGFRMWIGLWIFVILLLFVAFDLSALVKYITRFTEESFAALIALIFIVEAIRKQWSIVRDYPINSNWLPGVLPELDCSCELNGNLNASQQQPLKPGQQYRLPSYSRSLSSNRSETGYFLNHSALIYWDWESAANQKACVSNQGEWVGPGCGSFAVPDVFLFSCLLFIATYAIGYGLKAMRNSRYFPNRVRSIISDFAIMIAIVSMTVLDLLVGLHTPKLHVPEKFSPTLGYETRGWVVAPFGKLGQNPWYSALVALLPALLATILVFMDQQITAVIVNRKENKLRKGVGYHLDLLIVAILIGINSILGIPWFVAATVLSINHVMALKIESESTAPGERPQFLGCRENRLTGTLIFLLIGLSIFITPILKHIPMPVLYGVFLYMGISSLRGVQLVQRIALFIMPQKYQPDYKYLRHVKIGQVHKFTIIQIACLVLLWAVKAIKQISILFPIMVLAMCFVRKLLDFLFSQHELKWLDNIMPEFTLKPADQSRNESVEMQPQRKLNDYGFSESNAAAGRQKGSSELQDESNALLLSDTPQVVIDPPSGRASPVRFH